MDAFGFDNPAYGFSFGDPACPLGRNADGSCFYDPMQDFNDDQELDKRDYDYGEAAKEDRLKKLFSSIDPQYLKNLSNAGASGQTGMSMPAPGTPNIPKILDAVPMEYLIPLLGMTGVLGKQG
jgi:hypothetical protein